MSSCFMLSCFMLSPDCANAASETATRHIAINLPIIFFMNPPSFRRIYADALRRTDGMRSYAQSYRSRAWRSAFSRTRFLGRCETYYFDRNHTTEIPLDSGFAWFDHTNRPCPAEVVNTVLFLRVPNS